MPHPVKLLCSWMIDTKTVTQISSICLFIFLQFKRKRKLLWIIVNETENKLVQKKEKSSTLTSYWIRKQVFSLADRCVGRLQSRVNCLHRLVAAWVDRRRTRTRTGGWTLHCVLHHLRFDRFFHTSHIQSCRHGNPLFRLDCIRRYLLTIHKHTPHSHRRTHTQNPSTQRKHTYCFSYF